MMIKLFRFCSLLFLGLYAVSCVDLVAFAVDASGDSPPDDSDDSPPGWLVGGTDSGEGSDASGDSSPAPDAGGSDSDDTSGQAVGSASSDSSSTLDSGSLPPVAGGSVVADYGTDFILPPGSQVLINQGSDDLVSVITTVDPVSSSSTSGMKAALLNVLGDYDTIVVEYTYRNPSSSTSSVMRQMYPDYVWLCSAALFGLLIFCVFRLLGALLCRI